MSIAAVIPARYESSRFAGKPLAKATGKYLIQHVYERVCECGRIDAVLIATDDERIKRAADAFGGRCVMTKVEHRSGTDRVAEAAEGLEAEIIINVQGDEPDIEPKALDTLINRMEGEPALKMATLARRFRDQENPADPNMVKVVLDAGGCGLYFSRSPIPHRRGGGGGLAEPGEYLLHLGVYGYRRGFLLTFAGMAQSRLEKLEKLEQLRALEAGVRIAVDVVGYQGQGIDTPEEYEAWVQAWNEKSAASKAKD